jgi:putative flavoprotein involved in K+ transport
LFTPARYDGLPGLPFPAHPNYFPTKDEMGDYLESYAERFELPVRTGMRVTKLSRRDGRYVVECDGETLEADHVVVAMASYQKRRVPAFAEELRDDIVQIHSSEYRSPAQLRDGPVLIVGAGNSGAEIAVELVTKHRVVMSGRDVGDIPFRIAGFLGRLILVRLVLRVLFMRVLSIRTPIGRKVRPKMVSQGGPLIRTRTRDLLAAGIERVGRVRGVRDGLPELEDGRVLDVANVVWCTGYHPGFSWIDLPIHGDGGQPRHTGGVVNDHPGLYFVGLHFLYALSSGMVHGVGRDAGRIVKVIADAR